MVVEAEFGAELTGSESRADVALKDESVGIWRKIWITGLCRGEHAEGILAHLMAQPEASKASGLVVVAESSAGAIDLEGGAASDTTRSSGGVLWSGSMSCGGPANSERPTRCDLIGTAGPGWLALPNQVMWTDPEPVVETVRVGMRGLAWWTFRRPCPGGGGGGGGAMLTSEGGTGRQQQCRQCG